jgi:hypothetical protein
MNSSFQDAARLLEPVSEKLPLNMLGVIFVLSALYLLRASRSKIPMLNGQKFLELTATNAKRQFVTRVGEMTRSWFRAHPDKPVRITADFGEVTLFPNRVANEIRNVPQLSFSRFVYKVRH